MIRFRRRRTIQPPSDDVSRTRMLNELGAILVAFDSRLIRIPEQPS